MISVITASGLKIEFPRKKLDDWETVKLLRKIDDGEEFLIIDLADKLFGVDGVEKIKDHVRDDSGDVSFTSMVAEINGIFEAVKELKN